MLSPPSFFFTMFRFFAHIPPPLFPKALEIAITFNPGMQIRVISFELAKKVMQASLATCEQLLAIATRELKKRPGKDNKKRRSAILNALRFLIGEQVTGAFGIDVKNRMSAGTGLYNIHRLVRNRREESVVETPTIDEFATSMQYEPDKRLIQKVIPLPFPPVTLLIILTLFLSLFLLYIYTHTYLYI